MTETLSEVAREKEPIWIALYWEIVLYYKATPIVPKTFHGKALHLVKKQSEKKIYTFSGYVIYSGIFYKIKIHFF